jgi:hypothetical protein
LSIDWFRDLTIIIYGVVGAVFLIAVGIMAFALFRRITVILDSLKVTTANIEEISTAAKEQIVRPIIQFGTIFQGLTKWIEVISAYFKKSKKEVNDGQPQ